MAHYKRVTSNPIRFRLTRGANERRTRRSNDYVSLELLKTDSIFKMASQGDLEGLQSLVEECGKAVLTAYDGNRATCLHHAASANQIEVLQYLIDIDIDINAANKDGNTALHMATINLRAQASSILLDKGANDELLNNDGWTGLHLAVRSKNASLIQAYLDHGHINLSIKGHRKRTPLHIIADCDNLEACQIFHNSVLAQEAFRKQNGFSLGALDEDDCTPIHVAAYKGSHRVLDFFLTKSQLHGYFPEALLEMQDEENSTPLYAAVTKGEIMTVEVLLKHGANPLSKKGFLVPPFLRACSLGRLELVQAMFKSSHSKKIVACQDKNWQGCLHHCAHAINTQAVVSYLLDNGADINSQNSKGQTPLTIAVIAGNAKIAFALLERKANITIKDLEGNSSLHYAVSRRTQDIFEYILKLPEAEDLVSWGNNSGQTPFHRALRLGLTAMVNLMVPIITHKSKHTQDFSGNNYLHNATYSGDWKAITSLLDIPEFFLQLNETNKSGETPLHIAAAGGHMECVDLLLSHGAVIHKCHKGFTPFLAACLNGHAKVACALFTANPVQIEWATDCGNNGLHLGAKCGSPEVLTLCLDIGVPVVHNNTFESFFDIIILKGDAKSASAVIRHNRYQEALDLLSPFHEHPMLRLIAYMPAIAHEVLNRSQSKANLPFLHKNYWEKLDFKYVRLDSQQPVKVAESITKDSELLESVAQVHTPTSSAIEHRSSLSHLRALATMVQFQRSDLLTHPVSNAFLNSKWKIYGRWIHILLMFSVFLQVLFLLLFSTLTPRPTDILRALTGANATNPCDTNNSSELECHEIGLAANIFRFIALGLAIFNFALWVLIVVKIRGQAFNLVNNAYILIDILSVTFTIYYLIPIRGLNNAYWRAGAVGVFSSWFSLLLRIQLFDLFGLYITMFLSITRRVLQVLMVCLLFFIAFSISLYILAGNLDEYSNIGYSFFIIFGDFLGELNFHSLILADVNNRLQSDWLTFLFVLVIAVLLSIVTVNMLVGLAVGDIEMIKSEAITNKKEVEVSFFKLFDSIIPAKVLSKLEKSSQVKYPNRKVPFWQKYWRIFWRFLKGGRRTLKGASVQKDDQFLMLTKNVELLSLQQEKLMEKLNHMENVQEKMLTLIFDIIDSQKSRRDSVLA